MERKNLAKEMGFLDLFFLAFGIYAGVAWVTTLGGWLKHGPAAAILGFIICGIMLIPIGMNYAEMTPAIPVAGGELAFAYKAFGNFAATITGWFMSLAYIIVCPYEAISVSIILNYMFPGFNVIPLYTIQGFTIYLPTLIVGIGFSILFTVLNYRGVKQAKIFQTVASAAIFVLIIGFLIAAFVKGDTANLSPAFSPKETTWAAIFGVLGMAPFFLAGFDAIPQASEEADSRLSPRKIGIAIILAIVFGIFFYVVTTLAAAFVAPWQDTVTQSVPTAYAFEKAFGPKVNTLVMFGALLGLLTTWNGCFMAGTRTVFAMGRGRLMPSAFGKVHEKYKTPYVAVLFTGFISILGPFIGKAGLIPAVDVGAFAFVVAWASVCLSCLRLRKIAPNMNRPYKMPGGVVMSVIGIVICIFLLCLLIFPGSPSKLVWPIEWIVLFVWILLGLLFYSFITKKELSTITKEDQAYLILGEYRDYGPREEDKEKN